MRAMLGSQPQPFILPTNRFACVGCHAVSRDGQTLAYSYDRSYLGAARTEAPARALVAPADPPVPDATTVALNPDGTLVAVSQEGRLLVRETAGGRELFRLEPDAAGGRYFPDWSPDGHELAATQAMRAENGYTVNDGSIVALPWDGARLGAPRVLVAADAAQFHYHPAWSPDGAWLAFVSAPMPGRGYDNPQARLRLVSRAGDRTVELVAATAGKGAGWPRFAPAVHGGSVLYLSFDSRLDYGYLLRNSPDPAIGRSQLWLTALDLRKLPGDPSSAPLWLPLQDHHLVNVLGTWTERLVCGPDSPCPEPTRCDSGRCVPR
jgi:dipeptidyl aminopeptidase/acylaminoacyl peptidase